MDQEWIRELRKKYGIKIVPSGKQNIKNSGRGRMHAASRKVDTSDRPYYTYLRAKAGNLQRRRSLDA